MDNRIKGAFSTVHAETELKNKTKAFLSQKTQRYTKSVSRRPYIYAVSCTCILLLLFGGYWLYFMPTSEISIDINPSLKLSVNRFDRIISADGLNSDGQEFAKSLDIEFKNYFDALDMILESDDISVLLSNDEILTIMVSGADESQAAKILSDVEVCTTGKKNTYCSYLSSEEIEEANKVGLPYCKYKAFLELKAIDPDISPDAIQGMTMREIRNYINALSDDIGYETPSGEHNGHGHHNGNGCSKGNTN